MLSLEAGLELPEHLSPADCTALLPHTATLLCVSIPPGTDFGLDYSNWTLGPRFMGVKLVPPGLHFAWFRFGAPLCTGHVAALYTHAFFYRMMPLGRDGGGTHLLPPLQLFPRSS